MSHFLITISAIRLFKTKNPKKKLNWMKEMIYVNLLNAMRIDVLNVLVIVKGIVLNIMQ